MKKQIYVYLTEPKNPERGDSYHTDSSDLGKYMPSGWQLVEGEHFVEFVEICSAPAAEQAIKDLNKKLGELEVQATEIKREIASFLAIAHEVSE